MAKLNPDNVLEIRTMFENGVMVKDIAERFGVSQGRISQIRKELKIETVKHATRTQNPNTKQAVQKIVHEGINAFDQLKKINTQANEILNELMAINRGDKLDSMPGGKDTRELAARYMGEIRQQLDLQLKIMATLFDIQAVDDFMKEVLYVIGTVDEDARNLIKQRLAEKRAIYELVGPR